MAKGCGLAKGGGKGGNLAKSKNSGNKNFVTTPANMLKRKA